MKITKEKLKHIIMEEIQEQENLGNIGKTSVTTGQQVKKYKANAVDAEKQKGVDNKERGIITQIEANLQKLAALSDIKSGNVFAILNRLNKMMDVEIQKLDKASQAPDPEQ